MNLKVLLKIALCSTFLFTAGVSAQQTPTTLRGRIFNEHGNGVRNATITLSLNSKKTGFKQTTTSGAAGEYLFPSIPPGSYRIAATDSNGLTYENPSFDLPADRPARLDLTIEYGGDCRNSGSAALVVSEADKAGIVKEILRDALSKKQIPEYAQLTRQKTGIILSSDNIKAEWLQPLKKLRLTLLSDEEIRRKTEGGSEFMYLFFGEFKTKGDCVVAAVSNMWAVDTKSRKTPVSGGGKIYVYSKKGGKFRLKTSGRWNF